MTRPVTRPSIPRPSVISRSRMEMIVEEIRTRLWAAHRLAGEDRPVRNNLRQAITYVENALRAYEPPNRKTWKGE